ncbi:MULTISPECIES: hypothetical protein [Nostoc]|uniref:Uncharacterized protein n=2 Tax=Nostoc TaxID=1177 RepID=A0ABR8I137_9NOSO|nr:MULTISPECIES: hypothetical protein [Nostoc]MBD2561931.1 hypothetical protein [Nostoc linckia FACHB-391]MBD2644939.1 hypothetical protein [Nostoc foliaceum FACHB-393]
MDTSINTFKADSGEKVLKQDCLTKGLFVYQVFSYLPLGISCPPKQYKVISLSVKTGTVTSYVDNFSKTLNNYVAASNIFDCSISYIDIVSKLIACYSASDRTRLDIFDLGKESKFRKAEFPQVKIYEIPNNNKTRYKINVAHTEKSILTLFISIVENLLTGKTLLNNDVIKWLPSFNWEMNIVLFYLL